MGYPTLCIEYVMIKYDDVYSRNNRLPQSMRGRCMHFVGGVNMLHFAVMHIVNGGCSGGRTVTIGGSRSCYAWRRAEQVVNVIAHIEIGRL